MTGVAGARFYDVATGGVLRLELRSVDGRDFSLLRRFGYRSPDHPAPFVVPADLAADQRVLQRLTERAAAATAHLPHHEQVRAVIPAVDRFGAAGGLVTSTLKVRRREVEKAFAAEIDRTYAELRRRRRPTA